MAHTVIDAHDISKTYAEGPVSVHAVQHVHLHIERGEFVALVGPSGSGKTTLLNMIGGLDAPTAGKVYVNGIDMGALSPNALIDFRLHNIGFVFQAFNLIPVLTARENIEFIMLLQGLPVAEREARTRQLLEQIGLTDKAHARPGELSGGQQQRVAVARALASRPQFVLADEPTANLDSVAAGNLLDIMERLNQQEEMTFVFSTHDAR
ncbi:MAG: ABC transporter ATP-binding protein, partial [Chitinophagaceae bacterium]|nr:ABC transporter ATP-binding protein [Chitinophagaceae bacterium]